MRIAAYQGTCADGDVNANLAKTKKVFAEAVKLGADFLCMPETFLSGYGDRAKVAKGAMTLDDPRLRQLIADTAAHDTVLLVGMSEKEAGKIFNTELIIHRGELLGRYRKTMLTGGDYRQMGFATDWDVPVWQAKGITFGVIICADSSYIEVSLAMWWQGAQIIFSPHYNSIPYAGMDDHRIRVRNNHIGTAALLGVPLVRANVINWDHPGNLGYGDTAIFDENGQPLAEAGLFRERLITAEVDLSKGRSRKARLRIPMEVRKTLADCMARAEVAPF